MFPLSCEIHIMQVCKILIYNPDGLASVSVTKVNISNRCTGHFTIFISQYRNSFMLFQSLDVAPTTRSTAEFSINSEMLPFYLSSSVAQKILFIGESVHMFQHDRHGPEVYSKGKHF